VQFSEKSLELLADVLDGAAMEEDEIEDFGALADVFVPLSQAPTCRLRLHRQILEEAHKAAILDVGRLGLNHALHLFEVVENFLRLLHVVLVACLEDAALALLVVEEA